MEAFFPETRLRVDIIKPRLLRNQRNEKRIVISCSAPLEGDNLRNVPSYVDEAFRAVDHDQSAVESANVITELEAMNVSFHDVPTGGGKPRHAITGCRVHKLRVARKTTKGDTPSTQVALLFDVTAPGSKPLWGYVYEVAGATLFAEFVTTQQTLDLANELDEEQEAENDQPTLPMENAEAVAETTPDDVQKKPKAAKKKKAKAKAAGKR